VGDSSGRRVSVAEKSAVPAPDVPVRGARWHRWVLPAYWGELPA